MQQVADIRRFFCHADMRPVTGPEQALRIGAHQRVMKRPRLGIVGKVWRGPAQRQLDPQPALRAAIGQRCTQLDKIAAVDAGLGIKASHVIHHHRQLCSLQQRHGLQQRPAAHPDLGMPATLAHA